MSADIGRRTFMASSLAAVGAAAVGQGAEAGAAKREAYALYVYQFADAAMAKRADGYFKDALIPALRRAGAGPVGVFVEIAKTEWPANYYVVIPVASVEAAAELPRALDRDAEYAKAGEAFLKAPVKDPGYVNLEVRLMLATEFMGKLETPEKRETRLFELRRYRSPSEGAFRKKLEMFGAGGELSIFRRVGLNPVFFGEMVSGPDMPNITYMLSYADAAAKQAAWGTFRGDPDWAKLKGRPGYTDAEIIANIKSVMMKPTGYSEV